MKKKILCVLIFTIIAATVGIGGIAGTASAYDLTISDWGIEYFNKLDTGIYWYTDADNDVPTSDYEVKKDKPTIVFTHGWKPQGQSNVREGLSIKSSTVSAVAGKGFEEYKYDGEFYRYYLEKGYNVGVFYWNQLADAEGNPDVLLPSFSVDSKIWISENGENMSYITYDSEDATVGTKTDKNDPSNPKKSVAVLFGESLVNALGNDFSGTLQIAGHSMGGQLALAVSEYLCVRYDKKEIGENLLPDRVTLIDPYLNAITLLKKTVTVDHTGKTYEYKKGDTGLYTVQLAADAAENVRKHGIPIEGYAVNVELCVQNYKTILSFTESGKKLVEEITDKLKKNCVWVFADGLGLYGGFDPTHVMAVDWYFTTNNMAPVKSKEGLDVPCATLETEKLQSLIGLTFIQETPKGINPLYYDESTYSLVDFGTMKAYEETEPHGRIYGTVKVNGKNNGELIAKLVNDKGETVAESVIDNAGYYYFIDVADGEYTVKIYSGDNEKGTIEDVSVKGNAGISVSVQEKEISITEDKTFEYICIVLAVIVVIAFICGGIAAILKAVKKNDR